MELVSIITPSYNSSRFVAQTIESVLKQTYGNWELLITDDCSQDETVEIIRSFADRDSRIRLFPLKKNVGAAEARNNSLAHARGRYIAFLDSDDLWYPEKLERQLVFMREKGCAFSVTYYDTITEEGSPLGRIVRAPRRFGYRRYLRNTVIGCLTVVIDREQVGDFRMPDIRSSHDMALWLIIMRRGYEVYTLEAVLASYRLVSTSNTAKKWKAAKDVWRVYREYEKLSLWYSAYNFMGYTLNAVWKRL